MKKKTTPKKRKNKTIKKKQTNELTENRND